MSLYQLSFPKNAFLNVFALVKNFESECCHLKSTSWYMESVFDIDMRGSNQKYTHRKILVEATGNRI